MNTILRYFLGLFFLINVVSCDWDSDILIKNKSLKFGPKDKKSLIIGNAAEPESLDPQKASGMPEAQILKDLFEGLTDVNSQGKVVPGVADSWESKNNQIWTFHLREDAKWSNGEPVTADDFVYAWRRLADPNSASTYASYLNDMYVANAEEIIQGKLPTTELGVKAIDAHTLEVTLSRPVPYLPAMLIHQSVFPVYQAAIDQYGIKWTQAGHMVSNGAYQLKAWYVNNRIIAIKNPYYWNAHQVKIERVEYLPIEQAMTDAITFMSGSSDITYSTLPPEIYPRLETLYSEELKTTPQLCTYYYEINQTREPLKDVRVRQALSLLVERKNITDQVLKQGQKPAYTLTPSYTNNFRYYEPEWASWSMEKRTKKAKELLNAAGFNEQNPLKFNIVYNTQETHKTVALALYSEWSTRLNFIQVSLVNKEWKSYLDSMRLGDFDVIRRGWCGDYNEPSSFLNVYKGNSSNNYINYQNVQFDRLLDQSLQANLSDLQRQNIYLEAEKALMQDAVALVLYTYVAPRLVKSYVKGYSTEDPQNFVHVKDLEFEYEN
ncbi:oligopeptide ABC transporter substrate-binding protein OppA [Neisseriaceae bacterium PsAf]|nr:oligopeptide ABC transporter substrate-binding protein OppA [Neisseriaceae bacterium PsAf]